MPIVVKDYTWTQNNKMIHIRVPLNPGFREKVDIFTSYSYVKVFFSPFIFEVFLLHDIDPEKSKGLVEDDQVVLDLCKKEEIDWENIEKELTKPEKMKLKQEALAKCQEEAQQKVDDKRIKKTQLDRFTVSQAMEIDTKQHTLMDSRRDAERHKAMVALEEWRSKTVKNERSRGNPVKFPQNTGSGVTITELSSDEDIDVKKLGVNDISKKVTVKSITTAIKRTVKTPVRSEYVEKKREELANRVLPKMRVTAELEIKHTLRTFPTPSRESTAQEEQAWLANITMARRATGFVSEDLRPEEQDPQWCKEKGDEFFRNGNFLGAISAYSHGITLSDKLPSLFANRSATHFALGNFNKCMNDCSSALDLMKPSCEGNRRSRAKCIARRAAALARLGYLNKAIDEMKAAVTLLPEDDKIKTDLYDMERAWEQDPDSE